MNVNVCILKTDTYVEELLAHRYIGDPAVECIAHTHHDRLFAENGEIDPTRDKGCLWHLCRPDAIICREALLSEMDLPRLA